MLQGSNPSLSAIYLCISWVIESFSLAFAFAVTITASTFKKHL
ncbi:hypothetical protein [Seongchinamella sediminis]|nr:hypothetical protein [Seongchinamella sediminis]